jgi:hypothetical protein
VNSCGCSTGKGFPQGSIQQCVGTAVLQRGRLQQLSFCLIAVAPVRPLALKQQQRGRLYHNLSVLRACPPPRPPPPAPPLSPGKGGRVKRKKAPSAAAAAGSEAGQQDQQQEQQGGAAAAAAEEDVMAVGAADETPQSWGRLLAGLSEICAGIGMARQNELCECS